MSAFARLASTAREALLGRGIPRLKSLSGSAIIQIEPPPRVRLTIKGLEVVVSTGQVVEAGALVARSPETSPLQRRIHASLTGTIAAINENEVLLEGEVPDRPPITHSEPDWVLPEAITDTAREAGLIGMGGGMFPTYVKLSQTAPIDIVLVNGCESEPYLTCDHRVLAEHRDEINCGTVLAMHAVQAKRGLIIDNETYYPGGYERLLIRDVMGRVVPPRGLPRDVGVLVINAQSAHALHDAVCLGRPLIDRVITVGGGAVGRPGNYRVPLGTEVAHLMKACQIDESKAEALLAGGPMMGAPANMETPITGGTGGLLALTRAELSQSHTQPCIRCGHCIEACPFDLPAAYLIESPNKAVLGCVECGACQFNCPARIPLVSKLQDAKAVVMEWD